jgi:hypothetical protein
MSYLLELEVGPLVLASELVETLTICSQQLPLGLAERETT